MVSNVVKNEVVKKTEYNKFVQKVNGNTIDTSDLVKKADFNTKIKEIEKIMIMIIINMLILKNLKS